MDYIWTVSTPTNSGKLLMSVGTVRHRILIFVVVVVASCSCRCNVHLQVVSPLEKMFNVPVISGRPSLVSLIGLFVDLEAERWLNGCVFTYVA